MSKSNRSNIVKMLTKEQKLEIFKKYEKKTFSTKKAFAKEFGISTRTLNRVIDEMKTKPVTDATSALKGFNKALCEMGKAFGTTKGVIVDRYDYTVTKSQITIFKNDESRSVMKGYPKFTKLRRELIDSDFAEEALRLTYEILSLPDFVEKFSEGNITVDHEKGKVWYGTFEIKNSIVDQMMKIMTTQGDVKPLVLFLEKLMMNPKINVVEELYPFLKHNDIEISEEGDIIAYRSVTTDFKDHHTGTMDNSIGVVVTMPRSMVDDNPNQTCSSGLHVAAFDYANTFGSNRRLVKVRVNPSDVVSVPTDYDGMKMRVCKFEVLEEVL
ncbi:RIIB protein [Vibrio phage 1.101.O._10N.261.45.C6]|nr:RIIB protein [Vibrio phage 1.101.O._10N.261.45.C6]